MLANRDLIKDAFNKTKEVVLKRIFKEGVNVPCGSNIEEIEEILNTYNIPNDYYIGYCDYTREVVIFYNKEIECKNKIDKLREKAFNNSVSGWVREFHGEEYTFKSSTIEEVKKGVPNHYRNFLSGDLEESFKYYENKLIIKK